MIEPAAASAGEGIAASSHETSSSKSRKLIRLIKTIRNWPRTLLDHLQLTSRDYTCELRDGARLLVRGGTDDHHIIFEVFVEKTYPLRVSPGSIVVDVGAQIGCFTVSAALQGARVLSFEPFAPNFEMLEDNVRLNGLSNVSLFRAAVGARSGKRSMFLPDDPAHTGRYSLHPGRGEQVIEVPCMTLDEVVQQNRLQRIDVLKMDCQGSEYEILYEASPETLAKTGAILVECEIFEARTDWSIGALGTYLESLGFRSRTRGNLIYAERAAG